MTGRISVFLALCVLSAAVVAAIALSGSESQAGHLSPVPSFHVDIGSSADSTSTGNSYVEDPNGDFDASDQLMSVTTPLTRCVRRDVTDFGNTSQVRIVTDIIIQNADEMVGGDVRINFDPSLIQVFTATITPFKAADDFFTGFTGQLVGLINLPLPNNLAHRTVSAGTNVDNLNGAAFFAGTYQESRLFERSSESGPDVDSATISAEFKDTDPDTVVRTTGSWVTDGFVAGGTFTVSGTASNDGTFTIDTLNALVLTLDSGDSLTDEGPLDATFIVSFLTDRNAGQAPNGGVFVRINWDLQPASDGQDVRIDLKTGGDSFTGGGDITAATAFVTLTGEDPSSTIEIVAISGDELFDGLISVNKAIPDPCPPASVEDTPTPLPGFEPPPTPTVAPTSTPTAADGITLLPEEAVNIVGTSHTVRARVTLGDDPAPDIEVLISVLDGPNKVDDILKPAKGEAGVSDRTNANGELTLTYTSNGVRGQDEILACVLPDCKSPLAVTVTKAWVNPTATPVPTATPKPTPTAVLGEAEAPGGVPSTGNPGGAAGGSGGDWPLYALAASLLLVMLSGSGLLWVSRRRIALPWRNN